jgi:hypothetical protein
MSRLLCVFGFLVSFSVVSPALADNNNQDDQQGQNGHQGGNSPSRVPELSATGAAAGFALIAGGAAIVLGRRRARRRAQ